jgi:transposase
MKKKYIVNLTVEEKVFVHNVLNNSKTAKTYKKRANILLMADESVGKPATQAEISMRCRVSDVTIYHTLRDFCEHGLAYTLKFNTPENPPRPPIVTGEKEARIIALACGEPPQGFSRWTVRLLTEKVVELSILPAASRETVRRTLKKLNLSLT